MIARRFGEDGPSCSPLTVGLMVRDGSPGAGLEGVRATLLAALERGFSGVDLAPGYGGGEVERAVGRILREDLAGRRDEVFLSTKGAWADGSEKAVVEGLERSLGQIGVDCVDLYYHHAPDASTPVQETAGALARVVREGKAKWVGVSNYSLDQTIRMARACGEAGAPLVAHQPNYNLLNRWVEDGLLAALPGLGMGAAVFSVLNQGLLGDAHLPAPRPGSRAEKVLAGLVEGIGVDEPAFGRWPGAPRQGRHADAQDLEAIAQAVGRLRLTLQAFARERGWTLSQLAIQWALRHDAVTTALVGLSSPEQAIEAANTLNLAPLTDDDRRKLASLLPPRWGMI